MIDTIILRLHGIKKYPATVERLNRKEEGNQFVYFDKETGERFSENPNSLKSALYFPDTGNLMLLRTWSSMFIPSSSYDLAYCVNYTHDFIEFNFSIPKYIYGTNLFQFIEYYDNSISKVYDELKRFVDFFVRRSFFVENVDLNDLELFRFDLCYNQFFTSEENMEKYFSLCKVQAKQYDKVEGHNLTIYKTSFFLKCGDWTFKCYQKLPEMLKHDFPKLYERNPRRYDLENFKKIAGRILRWELQVDRSFMNFLFRRMYYEGSKKVVDRKEIWSKHARFGSDLRKVFKVWKIDGNVKGIKSKQFCFKSAFDNIDVDIKKGSRYVKDCYHDLECATFDIYLFREAHLFFMDWFNKFQISNSTSEDHFLKMLALAEKSVTARNLIDGRKRSVGKLLAKMRMIEELCKQAPLKDLLLKGIVSRRTYYRYLKFRREYGMGTFSPDVSYCSPLKGYQEYKSVLGSLHLRYKLNY